MQNVKSSRALTKQDLTNFSNTMSQWHIGVNVTNTNDPKVSKISIVQKGIDVPFQFLIHFNDPENEVNTLEDGGQIYSILYQDCVAGQKINSKAIQDDIKGAGWKIAQNHVYIETNIVMFQRDLLNLARILVCVSTHPENYLMNVR